MSEQQPGPPEQQPEKAEAVTHDPPRIWLASLADYNAGRLHGRWLDAAVTDEKLLAQAERVLASSPTPGAEEWAIFDVENFHGYRVGEYDNLADVARVARGIAAHGPAFAAWAELAEGNGEALDRFHNAYLGEFDNMASWAEQVGTDMGVEPLIEAALPESISRYVAVDYEAMARDAWLGGDIQVVHHPGGVWLFDGHA